MAPYTEDLVKSATSKAGPAFESSSNQRSNLQYQRAVEAILNDAYPDDDEDIYVYEDVDDKRTTSSPPNNSPTMPVDSLRVSRKRHGNYKLYIASPTLAKSLVPHALTSTCKSPAATSSSALVSAAAGSRSPTGNDQYQRMLSSIFKDAFQGDDKEEDHMDEDLWKTSMTTDVTVLKDLDITSQRIVSSPDAASESFFRLQIPSSSQYTASGYKYAGSPLAGTKSTVPELAGSDKDKLEDGDHDRDDEDVSMQDAEVEGVIDQSLTYMFNCWGLLDYQQYLRRIETSQSDSDRRLNSTILLHPGGAQYLSMQDYMEGRVFTELATDMRVILIDQLPLADIDDQFHGDVYLLAFDVPQKSFFVRRFLSGLPTDLDELSATWNSGRDVYNVKLVDLLAMIIESQEIDGSFLVPRLTDPKYCDVRDYPEELGMHIVIVIQLARWVIDFSDYLFVEGSEEEIEEVLGQVERCTDVWRLIVQRATEDSWRAFDNNFSEETYRQKLTANKELATSLHDVEKPGRFGLHFLGSQRPPRPVKGLDKAWLGSFRRPQRTPTADDVARVEARFSELFKAPNLSPKPPKLQLAIPMTGNDQDHHGRDIGQATYSDLVTRTQGRTCGMKETQRSRLGPQLTMEPPVLPPRKNKLDSQRPLFGSLDSFRRPSKEAAALLNDLAEATRSGATKSNMALPTRATRKTPAPVTDLFDSNPLEGDVEPFVDELDLTGLVTRMWQVAAQKPELDTTIARGRVRHLLRELGSNPGIPKHNQDLASIKEIPKSGGKVVLGLEGASDSGKAHGDKVTPQIQDSVESAQDMVGEETAATRGMAKEEKRRARGWRRVFGKWF